jgi:hypothetical protein
MTSVAKKLMLQKPEIAPSQPYTILDVYDMIQYIKMELGKEFTIFLLTMSQERRRQIADMMRECSSISEQLKKLIHQGKSNIPIDHTMRRYIKAIINQKNLTLNTIQP